VALLASLYGCPAHAAHVALARLPLLVANMRSHLYSPPAPIDDSDSSG
jgi:hypothetical protein